MGFAKLGCLWNMFRDFFRDGLGWRVWVGLGGAEMVDEMGWIEMVWVRFGLGWDGIG